MAALTEALAAARGGTSATLVLIGEPGVGKTALLDHLCATATGFEAVRVDGVESEFGLPYAALHRLSLALQTPPEVLSAVQSRALEVAFGMSSGFIDEFAIGMAALTMVAHAATRRPLLCVVDDSQWVDGPSVQALAFAARRLLGEAIFVVFARREDTPVLALDGLASLTVAGLDRDQAGRLPAVGGLTEPVVDRLFDETRGNPLAMIELAAEMEPGRRTAEEALPTQIPMTPRLQARFLRQAQALPADTQAFLVLASAAPDWELERLLLAASHRGLGADAGTAALTHGLIDYGGRVSFRHPLVRSAIYLGASESDRRDAHAALAEACDPHEQRDEAAWHRGVAAIPPDAAVADALEQSAGRARERGGLAAESTFMARAAELSPGVDRRTNRLLRAARAAARAGLDERAHALLDRAAPLLTTPVLAARAESIVAMTMHRSGDLPQLPKKLAELASRIETHDPRFASDLWIEALYATVMAADRIEGTTSDVVARGALANFDRAGGEPDLKRRLLRAVATRLSDGAVAAAPLEREVLAAVLDHLEHGGRFRHVELIQLIAMELFDEGAGHAAVSAQQHLARAQGAAVATMALTSLAGWTWKMGDLHQAERYYVEAEERIVALGTVPRVVGAAMGIDLAAWQGGGERTHELSAAYAASIEVSGHGLSTGHRLLALCNLELGRGRYEEAFVHANALFERDPFPHGTLILPSFIEAAVRSGRTDEALQAHQRLSERAVASGTPWARGLQALATALVSDGPEAETWYEEALGHLGRSRIQTDRARAHLLFGEWLRRQRRQTEAREQLRAAHEQLNALSAHAFAERASAELAATGERVRRRDVEARDDLTPREAQIADWAARRATNAEIAERLFISEATVAYHLRKVFRKVDVGSRRDLARALTVTQAAVPTDCPRLREWTSHLRTSSGGRRLDG